MPDRGLEQTGERQAAAESARRFQRQHPAGDRGRRGNSRERAARRDRLVLAKKFAPRIAAGTSGGDQRAHAARRLAQEPHAVAADMIHVRIDRGDCRRHGDHRFERIAAVG